MDNICNSVSAAQRCCNAGAPDPIVYHIPQLDCGYVRLDADAMCLLRNNHPGEHEYTWEPDDRMNADD